MATIINSNWTLTKVRTDTEDTRSMIEQVCRGKSRPLCRYLFLHGTLKTEGLAALHNNAITISQQQQRQVS